MGDLIFCWDSSVGLSRLSFDGRLGVRRERGEYSGLGGALKVFLSLDD